MDNGPQLNLVNHISFASYDVFTELPVESGSKSWLAPWDPAASSTSSWCPKRSVNLKTQLTRVTRVSYLKLGFRMFSARFFQYLKSKTFEIDMSSRHFSAAIPGSCIPALAHSKAWELHGMMLVHLFKGGFQVNFKPSFIIFADDFPERLTWWLKGAGSERQAGTWAMAPGPQMRKSGEPYSGSTVYSPHYSFIILYRATNCSRAEWFRKTSILVTTASPRARFKRNSRGEWVLCPLRILIIRS